jgi:hypothetical protein
MKKVLIHSSLVTLLATVFCLAPQAHAGGWSTFSNWFKNKTPESVEPVKEPVKPSSPLKESENIPKNETPKEPENETLKAPTKETLKNPKEPKVSISVEEKPFKQPPQWILEKNALPQALADMPYFHHVFLPNYIKDPLDQKPQDLSFSLDSHHPDWLRISEDGQYLEGNEKSVREQQEEIEIGIQVRNSQTKQTGPRQVFKISIDHQGPQPRWGINDLPNVAIHQNNYKDTHLNEFVTTNLSSDKFIFSLTSGKINPDWVSLKTDGILHIDTDKISLDDINTTQIIEVTATSRLSGHSTAHEIAIKVTPNSQLNAPAWLSNFQLPDAVPGLPYHLNLAKAVNINSLPENDQLIFQILKSDADWLQIGENAYTLDVKNIPADAAEKYFNVSLRVTSRMSGKSQDFEGRLYVNPIPLALQWREVPEATINQNYSLDLSQYISSNIHNDKFDFQVDLSSLPQWLTIQNGHVLTGAPLEASLIRETQKIALEVRSQVSGMSNKISFTIPIKSDPSLAPQWKTQFLPTPIAGEVYRSDDLSTVLDKPYPHDEYRFEYLNGPNWITYNELCHCLASKGDVPMDAAGKNFSVQLRVQSLASAKSLDYQQELKVYTGIPQWTKTQLPDIKIAQSPVWSEPLNNYAKDDISGDHFTYILDRQHSPSWLSFAKKEGQAYLSANPEAISPHEVGSTQTARIIAISQNTKKTSVQLLSIQVLANENLPRPAWKDQSLPVLTAGFFHAMDLNQYIKGSTTRDRLQIKLTPDNPSWLSIENNRLVGIPPRGQVGVLPPLNFIVHSTASNTDTIIQAPLAVQLVVVEKDNMETHAFYDNHQSIVLRGLKKNSKYKLAVVQGSHFDYGPFYSPHAIKSDDDWNGNPFYAVSDDKMIETGEDGVVSIVYYTKPGNPPPQFKSIIIR